MSRDPSIVIRGGIVVDGTGKAPFEADVAVTGNRIAAVGKLGPAPRGTEEIDARGLLVTPGFVDVHTHYDGQAVWDSHLAPSSWHGVTTAVMGNCGVGFAPVRHGDRQRLIELMEGVEDIPAPALHEGLDFRWESFADFLDVLDERGRDVDICTQLPHAALRVFVMGERATRLEAATPEDIARMRSIAADAMRAGAFGFSTSRNFAHRTLKGDPTPSVKAAEEELIGIGLGMQDAGHGFLEVVSDWSQPDAPTEFSMLRRVVEATGRPMLFSLAARNDGFDTWRRLMAASDAAIADGHSMRPVFPPRPIGIMLGLTGSQNPFSATPSYRSIADRPLAERVAIMRDPDFRRRVLSEDPFTGSTFPLLPRLSYAQMYPFGDPPDYTPPRENSLVAIAEREGRTPQEVAYDQLLRDDGQSFIFAPLTNYAGYSLSASRELLANRNAIVGLGDGGAHVGFICDGSFPTFLLTYWGRDGGETRFPVEELVRRQTSDTAHAIGLTDRGVIAPGKKADINVIDFDALRLERPYVVFDLPAGGRRFLQKARGYRATIVSGVLTYRDGEATGALPGRLLRAGQMVLQT